MKIGVISDTHGYLHPAVATYFDGVDCIFHAGDVGDAAILDRLEEIAPVEAVWGNVDGPGVRFRTTGVLRTEIGGVRIYMTHIGGRPGRWDPSIAGALAADPPDIFICGHSHILRIERVRDPSGMLHINPGAAGRQGLHQVKTCVLLEIADGNARKADVVHLDDDAPPSSARPASRNDTRNDTQNDPAHP